MTTTSPPFLTLGTVQIYLSLLAFLGYQKNRYSYIIPEVSLVASRGRTSPLLPLIFYDFFKSGGFGVKLTTT